jgi:hypothetical protein
MPIYRFFLWQKLPVELQLQVLGHLHVVALARFSLASKACLELTPKIISAKIKVAQSDLRKTTAGKKSNGEGWLAFKAAAKLDPMLILVAFSDPLICKRMVEDLSSVVEIANYHLELKSIVYSRVFSKILLGPILSNDSIGALKILRDLGAKPIQREVNAVHSKILEQSILSMKHLDILVALTKLGASPDQRQLRLAYLKAIQHHGGKMVLCRVFQDCGLEDTSPAETQCCIL